MYILRTISGQGWAPALITALAIVGYTYQWPVAVLIPLLAVILVISLVIAAVRAKEKQLEMAALRLRQLSGYFGRRFMGTSSLSIFVIIDSLFNIDSPQLWDWARACDMSQRVFDTWFSSFVSRGDTDARPRSLSVHLRSYLNELWLANNHYYEFVEQFYELARTVEIPPETIEQYHRFVLEYNGFVQNFRESVVALNRLANTEIEPPSVRLAQELSEVK